MDPVLTQSAVFQHFKITSLANGKWGGWGRRVGLNSKLAREFLGCVKCRQLNQMDATRRKAGGFAEPMGMLLL